VTTKYNKLTKIITTLIAFVMLMSTTGCGSDLFGNKEPPIPRDRCGWFMQEGPKPKVDNQVFGSIEVIIRAIRYSSNNICDSDFHVPVLIGVYATAEGQPAIKMYDGTPLPWNGERFTPWSATFVLTDTQNKRPPSARIKVDLIVKHNFEHPGNENITDRVALGCLIRINGNTIASDIVDTMKHGQSLRCSADFVF
jgi:hypothetical protein